MGKNRTERLRLHKNCGGTVAKRNSKCSVCGEKVEPGRIVLTTRHKYDPHRAIRQFERMIFGGVSPDSLFRYPRQ
jgi:hypothetical protein